MPLRVPHRVPAVALALSAGLVLTAAITGASSALAYGVAGRTDYAAGGGLEWVSIWDLNNDGHNDLVTANYATNNVSVLLSNGTGGFLPKVDYPAGTGPFTVVVADLNNDNKGDLLVGNDAAGTISVLLGNGDGTFGAKTDHTSGSLTAVAAVGYFNADPNVDVVTANFGANNVSVFLGDGAGGFSSKTDFATGANPNWVAVGDIDKDGKADLVTANYGASTISVLRGNGDGTFQPKVDHPCGAGPLTLTLAYLNGDNFADVATANYDANTVSVLLNDGTGGFGPKTDYPTAAKPVTVAAGDLDVDGRMDLATSNDATNTVSVLLGDGSGGLGTKTDYAVGTTPYAVAIGDLNDDGIPDLVSANYSTNDVSVLAGSLGGPGFRTGATAAAFTARDQNGTPRSLSDFLGSWVVLDLSSVWCAPCNGMAKDEMTVYQTWQSAGTIPFEYVTGLVDGRTPNVGATQTDATNWAGRYYITRPVLHEDGLNWGPNRSYLRAFGTNAYPTIAVINPAGAIVSLQAGAYTAQQLVDLVATLAGVPSPPLVTFTPPPPPPPPGAPRVIWQAPQSGNIQVGYGASSATFGLTYNSYGGDPNWTYALITDFPGVVPGVSGQGSLQVECSVDSTQDTQTVGIFVGSADGSPLQTAEPWTVNLPSLAWPDGLPRVLTTSSALVCVYYWTDESQTNYGFLCTPLSEPTSYTGGVLSVQSIPIGNVAELPPLTFAIYLENIVFQHAPGTLAVGPSAGKAAVALAPPAPNPARSTTALRWSLPNDGPMKLRIVDLAGRIVRVLREGPAAAGEHTTAWDLRDDSGQRVAPGLYYASFTGAGMTRTARLVVLQ